MWRFAFMAMTTLAGAGAAPALAPLLPECNGGLLAAEEAAWGDYNPLPAEGGMVVYDRLRGDARPQFQLVVEHCPSRSRMEALFDIPTATDTPWVQIDAYRARVEAAFASPQVFSLADLARIADDMAGSGSTRRVAYQSCACALYGGQ